MTGDAQDGAVGGTGGHPAEWVTRALERGEMSPKLELVAEFIGRNPQLAAFSSASEIARHVDVNVATVVRLAQYLDYSGWVELQSELRHRYLRSLHLDEFPHDEKEDPVALSLDRDIRNLRLALRTVNREDCAALAESIASARHTLIIAGGSHVAAGHVLAHLATVMGYQVRLDTHGGPALAAAIASLQPDDLLITVSFWRLYRDIVEGVKIAKARGIRTAAVTDSAVGQLTKTVDRAIIVPTEGIEFFQSITAAVSIAYGILGHLRELAGEQAEASIQRVEDTWHRLGTLYHPSG